MYFEGLTSLPISLMEMSSTLRGGRYPLKAYRQLRARRVLSIFKDVPLRTRRALSLYNVYGDNALLVLSRTSLNSDSALLALN